jgi:ribosomal protein S18 acetylase RimI-like enzyme
MPAHDIAQPLDNPIWYSLTGPLAPFGEGTPLAKRMGDAAVATADHSAAAFADLLTLIPAGATPVYFDAHPPDAIPGLTIYHDETVLQLVCDALPALPPVEVEIVPLVMDDAPEIAALVELTQPGPFFPAMLLMGPYIGLRVDGKLIAVSGQRMHPTSYREISTVCVHPDFQGRGYAALLVATAAQRIFEQGEIPFLHVLPDNVRAQRLYTRLGFRVRSEMHILVIGR